jgi:hypothetical protein
MKVQFHHQLMNQYHIYHYFHPQESTHFHDLFHQLKFHHHPIPLLKEWSAHHHYLQLLFPQHSRHLPFHNFHNSIELQYFLM